MDADQRYYVEQVVTMCMDHHQDVGAFHNQSKPPGFSSKVVVQMGGGCILYMEPLGSSGTSKGGRSTMLLQPGTVLEAMCDCIFASEK